MTVLERHSGGLPLGRQECVSGRQSDTRCQVACPRNSKMPFKCRLNFAPLPLRDLRASVVNFPLA